MFVGKTVELLRCTELPSACDCKSWTDTGWDGATDGSGVHLCGVYKVHWNQVCQGTARSSVLCDALPSK